MKALFVTGTDTGCGKTRLGVTLAGAARRQGLRVRVLKPIETGCVESAGERRAADAESLARAARDDRRIDAICPYRLLLPASPLVAARAEGLHIDLVAIEKAFEQARDEADLVIVEGAGGLRVPISPTLDMAGLAQHLGLPLLVVARAALGTYNHTQLTLEAATARGLPILGVVVSHTTPDLSAADRSNLDGLLADLPVPLLGELAYGAQDLVPPVDTAALLGMIEPA